MLSSLRGYEVNEGEDQNPHQVDEVPEQAYQLDRAVIALVVFAAHRADENGRQVADPGEDVAAVKAGDDVERIGVSGVAEDQPLSDEAGAEEPEVLVVL